MKSIITTRGVKTIEKLVKEYCLKTTYVGKVKDGPEEEWWEDRLVTRTDYANGVIVAKTGWCYLDEDMDQIKPACDSRHSGCICTLNYIMYYTNGIKTMEIIFDNNMPWRTYFFSEDGMRTDKISHI